MIDETVRSVRTGSIAVRGVDIEEREEPGEQYVRVSVELSRPTRETWPSNDFYELRRRVREAVVDSVGTDVNLRLTYLPEPDSSSVDDVGPSDEPSSHGRKPVEGTA